MLIETKIKGDVLIVDDTVENLKVLTALLEKAGHAVRPINNGELALQAVRAALPDLILLDIRMPDLDGYEVCSRLKADKKTRDVPIIFVSAQSNLQDKLRAFQVGGVDYITKPFQLEEVRVRVETQLNLLHFRRRTQEHIESLAREIEARKKVEKELLVYQENLEELVMERTAKLEIALNQERNTRSQLIHADRLASMGRLSASVAHEIKNPMQSILGCLGLAEEAVEEGRSADRYFVVARDSVHRITDILGRMRDLNRPSEDSRMAADVNQVIEKVVTLTQKHFQDGGVEIFWDPDPNLPDIWMMPDQINQVFLNLMLNARDAMPSGGNLRIYTNHTTEPDGVQIDFIDEGSGISAEDQERIFEPFFTTKNDGSGLGLAISFSIIERHNGHIRVSSVIGKGSTFSVWLPISLR